MQPQNSLNNANTSNRKLRLALGFFTVNIVHLLTQPKSHLLFLNAVSSALVWVACAVTDFFRKESEKQRALIHNGKEIGIALSCATLFQIVPRVFEVSWMMHIAVPWVLPVIASERFKRVYIWETDNALGTSGWTLPSWRYLILATVFSLLLLLWGSTVVSFDDVFSALLAAVFLSSALARLDNNKSDLETKVWHVDLLLEKQHYALEQGDSEHDEEWHEVPQALRQASGVSAIIFAIATYLFEQPLPSNLTGQPLFVQNTIYLISGAIQLWMTFQAVFSLGRTDVALLSLGTANVTGFLKHVNFGALAVLLPSLLNMVLASSKNTTGDLFPPPAGRFGFQLLCMLLLIGIGLLITNTDSTPLDWIAKSAEAGRHYAIIPPTNSTNYFAQHPIEQLIDSAEAHVQQTLNSQSKSFDETIIEYRRRYRIPPPPAFDKWYSYAESKDVQIYDSYDTIHEVMLPFWALKPATIRARVQEAIGYEENFLMIMIIRNGKILKLQGGLPWQREALQGLIEDFVEHLPDLDMAFNAHDEPRIVLPHDQLSRMVEQAKDAQGVVALRHVFEKSFSRRPSDMTEGQRIREYKDTRFNEYPQQSSSGPSRLSCAPDSPARAIDDLEAHDNTDAYSYHRNLSFISNHTAYTDVCNTPSFKGTHAFFDRPNAFNVAHDLIPIFSESKISSFQDIPYPSLWHWYGKIFVNNTQDMHIKNRPTYDPDLDQDWEHKKDDLYWRGSTTGGYSRTGGWRRHHRQRVVHYLNGHEDATVLAPSSSHSANISNTSSLAWSPQKLSMKRISPHINVTFSGVGQCAPNDCNAQKEYFKITPYANISDAYRHRYLLDMDGNAFSARFYGLMRSKSLVFKQAIFREWHDEWLVPWAHYIPLSLNTGLSSGHGWETPSSASSEGQTQESEWAEALRYFVDEDGKAEGRGEAGPGQRLAAKKRTWTNMVLRREDMQAWMFRLLLEYARVVDDRREVLGYVV